MKSFENQPIKFDYTIFNTSNKKEFTSFLKKNQHKISTALNDFLIGIKNEAVDTKDASKVIVKFITTQNISKEDEKLLRLQVYDKLKIIGVGIPFMLIPGASLLIPFILKSAEKKGIDLYPSNFGKKEKATNQED